MRLSMVDRYGSPLEVQSAIVQEFAPNYLPRPN
jgi:hypothetical protein